MDIELAERVKQVMIKGLNLEDLSPEDIGLDDALFGDGGLGLDSVDALELVMEVERNFGCQLQDDASSREVLTSIRTLTQWIAAQSAS